MFGEISFHFMQQNEMDKQRERLERVIAFGIYSKFVIFCFFFFQTQKSSSKIQKTE